MDTIRQKIQGNSDTVLGQNKTALQQAHRQPTYCQLLVYCFFRYSRKEES